MKKRCGSALLILMLASATIFAVYLGMSSTHDKLIVAAEEVSSQVARGLREITEAITYQVNGNIGLPSSTTEWDISNFYSQVTGAPQSVLQNMSARVETKIRYVINASTSNLTSVSITVTALPGIAFRRDTLFQGTRNLHRMQGVSGILLFGDAPVTGIQVTITTRGFSRVVF